MQGELIYNEFERWLSEFSEKEDNKVLECMVGRKNIKRMIEKSSFNYRNDYRYLTDIVRGTLTYNNMTDICNAIKLLYNDQSIQVLRDKNRLNPQIKSWFTGGYRDLLFNVRFYRQNEQFCAYTFCFFFVFFFQFVCETHIHIHNKQKKKKKPKTKRKS